MVKQMRHLDIIRPEQCRKRHAYTEPRPPQAIVENITKNVTAGGVSRRKWVLCRTRALRGDSDGIAISGSALFTVMAEVVPGGEVSVPGAGPETTPEMMAPEGSLIGPGEDGGDTIVKNQLSAIESPGGDGEGGVNGSVGGGVVDESPGLWPEYCNPSYRMPSEIEVKVRLASGETLQSLKCCRRVICVIVLEFWVTKATLAC